MTETDLSDTPEGLRLAQQEILTAQVAGGGQGDMDNLAATVSTEPLTAELPSSVSTADDHEAAQGTPGILTPRAKDANARIILTSVGYFIHRDKSVVYKWPHHVPLLWLSSF